MYKLCTFSRIINLQTLLNPAGQFVNSKITYNSLVILIVVVLYLDGSLLGKSFPITWPFTFKFLLNGLDTENMD